MLLHHFNKQLLIIIMACTKLREGHVHACAPSGCLGRGGPKAWGSTMQFCILETDLTNPKCHTCYLNYL